MDELIEAQLLVPELGISITGPEPIDALIESLAEATADAPAAAAPPAEPVDAESPGTPAA